MNGSVFVPKSFLFFTAGIRRNRLAMKNKIKHKHTDKSERNTPNANLISQHASMSDAKNINDRQGL